jgi:hypothetical protein
MSLEILHNFKAREVLLSGKDCRVAVLLAVSLCPC